MDTHEKNLRLGALELALLDLDRIIATMEEKNYPKNETNEYIKKRWEVWNEIHKVKKT